MKYGRALLVLVSWAVCATAAHGQASPTATGPGGYISVGGAVSAYNTDYGKAWLKGATVYVDVNPTRKIGVEGEYRFLLKQENTGIRERTLMGGPKYSFRNHGIDPYAKVLVGLGWFDFPFGYATGRYFVLAPGAGVDWRIGRKLQVRLIEFQYQSWPQFTYGTMHPYGFSSGISFRVF